MTPRSSGAERMTIVPLLVVGLIIVLGGLGLIAPGAFVDLVARFQVPPVLYLSALVRTVVGLVLIRVAPTTRAPRVVRVLGITITVGGLITPFAGEWIGRVILEIWARGGSTQVRLWSASGLLLGLGLLYSLAPRRQPR